MFLSTMCKLSYIHYLQTQSLLTRRCIAVIIDIICSFKIVSGLVILSLSLIYPLSLTVDRSTSRYATHAVRNCMSDVIFV